MASPSKTIRAVRYYDAFDIRIERIEPQPIESGHVEIKPHFVGICGSDLHFYLHSDFAAAMLDSPHPLTGMTRPMTLGHEFAGIVTAVGDGCVKDLKVGDKVAVLPTIVDYTCHACIRGSTNCCKSLGFVGINGKSGGLGDLAVVNEKLAFKLPESIDCDIGALIEPLSVAWHGVSLADQITPSTSVVVFGAGPIGCAIVLCLLSRGIRNITVSEVSQSRRDIVSKLGARHIINPNEVDATAAIMDITENEGVDAAFDCAGFPATMNTACAVLRAKGVLVNLAVWSGPSTFHPNSILLKEGTVKCSISATAQDFQDVINAIENGSLQPRDMITKRIKLEDVVQEGFETLRHTGENQCKILIDLEM